MSTVMDARASRQGSYKASLRASIARLFGSSLLVASGRYAYISASRPADDERRERWQRKSLLPMVSTSTRWLDGWGLTAAKIRPATSLVACSLARLARLGF